MNGIDDAVAAHDGASAALAAPGIAAATAIAPNTVMANLRSALDLKNLDMTASLVDLHALRTPVLLMAPVSVA